MPATVQPPAEPAAAPANTEPAKTEQAPAVPTLDAIKQERYAAADAALVAHQKEVTDKAAADALAAKQAEQAKAAEADQVAQLTTKLTEAQTQATTLAERAKMAEKLEAASTLAKSGKHYDALKLLQEATGADMDLAVQELINPGSAPKPAQTQVKDEEEPESVKALREQVESLTKRLADADKAQADMMKEAGRKSIVSHVNETKAEYPFLSSNEAWINAALVEAEADYAKAVTEAKGQDLTQEQKNSLIENRLKLAEAQHKEQAMNYAKILGLPAPAGTVPVKKPTDVVTPQAKPTLTYTGTGPGQTPAVAQGKAKSLEELKRARRQAN